jgi:Tol biopolymer transport system component
MSVSSGRPRGASRPGSSKWVVTGVALLVAVGSMPAIAYQRPGRTERVSMSTSGAPGLGVNARINTNGRYVAFASNSSNLVPDDTNGVIDVFVRDRKLGTTERVSVASDGTEANNPSGNPAISGNGRFVAFSSLASNLVSDDTNGHWDIFVHDLKTKITERVSVASDGTEANGTSVQPFLSADGRLVAFQSSASNLVPDDTNGANDIFVHDRQTGTTERVSVAGDGTEGNAGSLRPSLSADGRHVSFHSNASNLVANDNNATTDVFVHDRATSETERVSVASDGTEGNGLSTVSSISANGRYVAFYSFASNLVPNDTNLTNDVFVHDRETGITERVSVTSEGREGDSSSFWPDISPDGRYVAFESFATNLVPDDNNRVRDIFVHDRQTRTTERVSVAFDGTESDGSSAVPGLSLDGGHVAFNSFATNLEPGGTTGGSKIYVRERGPAVGIGDLAVSWIGDDEVEVSGWAPMSGITISSVEDLPVGSAGAERAGADLAGASVVLRPEPEDLLIRLHLASLPPSPAAGGAPGVLYGLGFDLDGERYEVRGTNAPSTTFPLVGPSFALYRCDPDCVEQRSLLGAIGTTDTEVLVSVPLAALDLRKESALENVQAFAGIGDRERGGLVILDQADLPDAFVPEPQVSLGLASAGTPDSEVVFEFPAALSEGNFSGLIDVSALSAGAYSVWARGCLGEVCGTESAPLTVGEAPAPEIKGTMLELSVIGHGQSMRLRARLTEDDVPSVPLPDKVIDFYSDGELIGSAVTDGEGVAETAVPPSHRGANRTYEAIFEGDDFYGGSADSRPGRTGGSGESGGTSQQHDRTFAGAVFPR